MKSHVKILKSDFTVWNNKGAFAEKDILIPNAGFSIKEVVILKNNNYKAETKENNLYILLPIYGRLYIENFSKCLNTGEVFILKSDVSKIVSIKNILPENSDFLVIEYSDEQDENFAKIEEINLSERNLMNPISVNIEAYNAIGLFDGRKEWELTFPNPKNIFAMVINGVFEFNNRLMEARDAILMENLDKIEFEALSENALIIILETIIK